MTIPLSSGRPRLGGRPTPFDLTPAAMPGASVNVAGALGGCVCSCEFCLRADCLRCCYGCGTTSFSGVPSAGGAPNPSQSSLYRAGRASARPAGGRG
jgi:hypothetical protein